MKMIDESDMDLKQAGFISYAEAYGMSRLELVVNTQKKSKHLGVDKGCYTIINTPNLHMAGENYQITLQELLIAVLKKYLRKFKYKQSDCVLVCGIGNREIVADSLGNKAINGIFASRLYKSSLNFGKVAAICPMVKTQTGIETFDIVDAVAKQIDAKIIILIDSLMTKNLSRIAHSFQFSSSGLTPGGAILEGVKISKNTTDIPCITIGVPLMINSGDACISGNEVVLTCKDIGDYANRCARYIAHAVNGCLNKTLTPQEIVELKN